MALNIIASPTDQTLSGQPAATATTNESDNAASATEPTVTPGQIATDVTAAGDKPDDANSTSTQQVESNASVNISPDALRQITNLSKGNRELKKQLAEAQAKLIQPEDVKTKLARFEQLESALKDPKKWMELAELDIEKVYESVLPRNGEDASSTTSDKRVTDLVASNQEIRKELDALKQKDTAKETAQVQQQQTQQKDQAVTYTKSLIEATKLADGSLRWDRLTKSADAAQNAIDAVMIVAARDYAEQKDTQGNITRQGKTIDSATANKILEQALDEAEAIELARELVEQRKKTGQSETERVESRGISFRSVEDASTRRFPAKPTADGNRGPTRTVGMQRGPVSAAQARARALRMVGADEHGK
jgi:hypothetical protein